MEPYRSRLGQMGRSYMTDSVWSQDPKGLDTLRDRDRTERESAQPSPYYMGARQTLQGLESGRSTSRRDQDGIFSARDKAPKEKSRNVMMNVAMASLMQQEDRNREERKELLTRAAEMQSRCVLL